MGHSNSKLADYLIDPLDFGPITSQEIQSPTDYDIKLVKRFIKEGRLAPFYKGNNNSNSSNNNKTIDKKVDKN